MPVKIQTGAEFNYLKKLQNNAEWQIAGVMPGTGSSLPTEVQTLESHWVGATEGDLL